MLLGLIREDKALANRFLRPTPPSTRSASRSRPTPRFAKRSRPRSTCR
ncbi:MAG: hypothetical protein R2724_21050 [Bryobacterales bacterium]